MLRIILAAGLSLIAVCASAETRTGDAGIPFCSEKDDLQEFLTAMIKKDRQWISQLKGCAMLKGGLKVGVIEEYPSDSDIGHVDKIRVFGNGGSTVGYTLNLGLEEK